MPKPLQTLYLPIARNGGVHRLQQRLLYLLAAPASPNPSRATAPDIELEPDPGLGSLGDPFNRHNRLGRNAERHSGGSGSLRQFDLAIVPDEAGAPGQGNHIRRALYAEYGYFGVAGGNIDENVRVEPLHIQRPEVCHYFGLVLRTPVDIVEQAAGKPPTGGIPCLGSV